MFGSFFDSPRLMPPLFYDHFHRGMYVCCNDFDLSLMVECTCGMDAVPVRIPFKDFAPKVSRFEDLKPFIILNENENLFPKRYYQYSNYREMWVEFDEKGENLVLNVGIEFYGYYHIRQVDFSEFTSVLSTVKSLEAFIVSGKIET